MEMKHKRYFYSWIYLEMKFKKQYNIQKIRMANDIYLQILLWFIELRMNIFRIYYSFIHSKSIHHVVKKQIVTFILYATAYIYKIAALNIKSL